MVLTRRCCVDVCPTVKMEGRAVTCFCGTDKDLRSLTVEMLVAFNSDSLLKARSRPRVSRRACTSSAECCEIHDDHYESEKI